MFHNDSIYFSLLPILIIVYAVIISFNYFALTWHKRNKTAEQVNRLHKSFLGIFFREFWIWLTNPIVVVFKFFKLTPNAITVASLFFSILTAYLYFRGHIYIAGWVLAFGGSLDFMDGRIARETGQMTRAGAFLDSCMDRYSDAIIFLGITLYFAGKHFSFSGDTIRISQIDFYMIIVSIAALIGSEVMSYVKARGEVMGFSTRRGLMQREERLAMLAFFSCADQFYRIIAAQYNLEPDGMFMTVIIVMCILINFSAAVRFVDLFRQIKKSEKGNG